MANGEFWEKYKHPKWQEKRLRIMERDGFKCCDCGSKDKTLQVHHKLYRRDAEPWDYEEEVFVTLCERCHEHADAARSQLREMLKHLTTEQVQEVCGYAAGLACRSGRGPERVPVVQPYADGVAAATWAPNGLVGDLCDGEDLCAPRDEVRRLFQEWEKRMWGRT